VAKGEIEIDGTRCQACGFCVDFCKFECITIPQDRLGPKGFPVAVFSAPDKCNACGICGWMCPDFGVRVYKYVEREAGVDEGG
jgi:NAD-dependent dihydropyrimidine dehydrogenase PreA subunit